MTRLIVRLSIAVFAILSITLIDGCSSSGSSIKISKTELENWPKVRVTESDYRRYYDANRSRLDPIEGIYRYKNTVSMFNNAESSSPYRLAIVRSVDFPSKIDQSYDFIAVILESDNPDWPVGSVKALFRGTAYMNYYEAKWFMGDYSAKRMEFQILENGIVYSATGDRIISDVTTLTRSYPLFDQNTRTEPKVDQNATNDPMATGSGFVLTKSGMVVTNHHVIADAKRIEVYFPKYGVAKGAKVKLKDIRNDIAVLEVEGFASTDFGFTDVPFAIADDTKVKIGQDVFTLGFPLGALMGGTARLAAGTISSIYGLQDDPRLYQISNPIQPGNSGGALFNQRGELVGICVSGLSARYFYENLGIVPQNMNFAVKSSYLKSLVGMLPDGETATTRIHAVAEGTLERVVEQLNPFVVQIRVY